MVSYSIDALGDVVRRLRLERGLTQEQLGNQAGYGRGAGVSISRLEHGLVRPSTEKLSGIATALGIAPEALEHHASQATLAPGATTPRTDSVGGANAAGGKGARPSRELKARATRIQAVVDDRTRLLTALGDAFNDQHDRAAEMFFLPFVRLGPLIQGAPQPGTTGTTSEAASADVDVEALWAASATLHQALDGSAYHAAGPANTMPSPGAPGTFPGSTPWNAAVAAASGGRFKSGGARVALGTAVLTGILAAPTMILAAGGLVWMTRRSRRQQVELAANLDAAEAELQATAGGVKTLSTVLPHATATLGYIATHAGHALGRWPIASIQHPVAWDSLDAPDRQRFREFSDIAAAHLAISSIAFQELLTAPGDSQHVLVAHAEDTLSRAHAIVTTRV